MATPAPAVVPMTGASGSSSNTIWDSISNHQTFFIVALLVGVHLILLAVALACLWRQTPKDNKLAYRAFLDDQREEFKRSIQKTD